MVSFNRTNPTGKRKLDRHDVQTSFSLDWQNDSKDIQT